MPKISRNKVRLEVVISKDLYERLRTLAPQLYGKHRGALSYIVENALKQYFSLYCNTHKAHINPPLSVRREFNMFLDAVKEYYGEVPYKLPAKVIRNIMMTNLPRSKDIRTQNKKLHTWYLMGFIKPLDAKPSSPNDWRYVKVIEFIARGEV